MTVVKNLKTGLNYLSGLRSTASGVNNVSYKILNALQQETDRTGKRATKRIGGILGCYDVVVEVWRSTTGNKKLKGRIVIKTKAQELVEEI